MSLIEYLSALGLMMVGFAFLYRNRTKHYREYLSRPSAIGSFRVETPCPSIHIEPPRSAEEMINPGDTMLLVAAPISDAKFYCFQPPGGAAIVRRNCETSAIKP